MYVLVVVDIVGDETAGEVGEKVETDWAVAVVAARLALLLALAVGVPMLSNAEGDPGVPAANDVLRASPPGVVVALVGEPWRSFPPKADVG